LLDGNRRPAGGVEWACVHLLNFSDGYSRQLRVRLRGWLSTALRSRGAGPVFAVLDRERARLPGVKIDAAAWPWRNANFMRFSAAWLAEARDVSQGLAGGWNHPRGGRRAEAAAVAGAGTHG
jgi:hypothetical protein